MSPIREVESLGRESGNAQAKAAISSCIATMVKEGKTQEQAVAMCTEMVKAKMGREMMPQGGAGGGAGQGGV